MSDAALVRTSLRIAVRDMRGEARRFAAREIGAARIDESFDRFVRREKKQTFEEREGRDFPLATETSEWLVEFHDHVVSGRSADVRDGNIKNALTENEIDDNLRVLTLGRHLRFIRGAFGFALSQDRYGTLPAEVVAWSVTQSIGGGFMLARTRVCLSAAWLLCACPGLASAQQLYPSKPVRILSPFAPGGGNDNICRIIAPRLSESLKQQVIIENRPGANGIVGTEAAARAAPDGYTIVLIPSGHAVNATLYKKLPYDSLRDFAPITLVASSPLVLAMHPSVPTKNVKELIALAKGRPGQLTYGSAGVGSSGHLAGALFETLTGTKMVHIPYKGMGLVVTDLLGGQVSLTFGTSASVMPQVRAGRLRALATTGAQRSPALPDIATVAESGVSGYEASLWYGFVGPARIPPDIVQRLNTDITAVLKQQAVRERLATEGVDVRYSTPEEFVRLLSSDIERWAKVVQRAGVRVE